MLTLRPSFADRYLGKWLGWIRPERHRAIGELQLDWGSSVNGLGLRALQKELSTSSKLQVSPVKLLDPQEVINSFLSRPGRETLSVDMRLGSEKGWKFVGAQDRDNAKDIEFSTVSSAAFSSGYFGRIIVSARPGVVLKFQDATIKTLVLMAQVQHESFRSVTLSNCWVQRIELSPGCVVDFSCRGGGILDFDCPPPDGSNPFSGSVIFSNVFVPRARDGFPIEGAQPYRNLRSHLARLQNGPAASFFHSAELAMERTEERGLNRLFNYLYGEFSDYGASPVLPLTWLGLLWLATTALLFATGVDFGGSPNDAVGWQSLLYQTGWTGDLLRAVIVGFQPISWLGALISPGQSVPMVPHSLLAQIWLVIDGILSTVLLALFIFALRRRFRLAA